MKNIILGISFGFLMSLPSFAGVLDRSLNEAHRSDPSESIESLNALAKGSEVTNILAFLNALPSGSYPTFTLITNSRSLQRGTGEGEVSNLWPRIVRTSKDGKITLSYVCNPRSEAYNRIEVIFFDDTSETFRTMTYDLAHRAQILDQRMCMSCHSLHMKPSTFQPIWPEHRNWRDCEERRGISLYGGFSDRIGLIDGVDRRELVSSTNKIPHGCGMDEDRQMQIRETEAYEKFRKVQQDNPCYANLPWTSEAKVSNTRVTTNYSRLVAKKNARVLRAHENFQKIEPYLLLEGLGCLKKADFTILSKLLGKDVEPKGERNIFNPESVAPVLYQFGYLAGLRPRDWNLVQNANEPGFKTGTSPMNQLVFEELLGDRQMSCEQIRRRL